MAARPRRFAREIASWLAFAAVLTVARGSLADHYRVPTGSMEPTVEPGDHIVVAKAAYGLRVPFTTEGWVVRWASPSRGDVVVLDSPEDGTVLLKRVVAVAGEVVEVKGGRLRIDGRQVAVDAAGEHLGSSAHAIALGGGGPDFGPVRVPAGHALVLGDNRGNSRDGRTFGFVRQDTIFGRAEAVVARDGSITWQAL
jgi:signal peptidase I